MSEKEKIYDAICRINTTYEEILNREDDDCITDDLCLISGEMYKLLVNIQNKWETVITVQEDV